MKFTGSNLSLIVVTLGLFGCAAKNTATVRDADEKMIANAKYLGDVSGTSGWGGLAASRGIENAKKEAREQAAALGANGIVWTSTIGGYSPAVSGRAYKLNP
jgi:hypothetical protein